MGTSRATLREFLGFGGAPDKTCLVWMAA